MVVIAPARRWAYRAALDAGEGEDRGEEKAAYGAHAGIITTRVLVRKSKIVWIAAFDEVSGEIVRIGGSLPLSHS